MTTCHRATPFLLSVSSAPRFNGLAAPTVALRRSPTISTLALLWSVGACELPEDEFDLEPFAHATDGATAEIDKHALAESGYGAHPELTENAIPHRQDNDPEFVSCTDDEKLKIQRSLSYATHRVLYGGVALERCLDRAYMWTHPIRSGRSIIETLSSSPNLLIDDTTIECSDRAGTGWWAPSTKTIGFSRSYIENLPTRGLGNLLAHEISHSHGYDHPESTDDFEIRTNTVPYQLGACIGGWEPIPSRDKDFVIYVDEVRDIMHTAGDLDQARSTCQEYRRDHPQSDVRCYYDGSEMGYEIYRNGRRANYWPEWSYSQAKNDCQHRKGLYPEEKIECFHDGRSIGYSLYFDGQRAGFEPKWTLNQARENCIWNKNFHFGHRVECYYDETPIGFELYWDGFRVLYEPGWDASTASDNCYTNGSIVVECRHDGNWLDLKQSANR